MPEEGRSLWQEGSQSSLESAWQVMPEGVTLSDSGSVRCSISVSVLVGLLKSGVVTAEQLRCADDTSAAQLKRIVLLSC